MNKSSLSKVLRNWQLYLLLILPLAYLIIFCYVPMAGLQIAFRKFQPRYGIWGSEWVGLYQFQRFFNSYQFIRVLKNTLILSLYSILLTFPFPIIFALILNTMRHERFKKIVQTVTYMPHFISTVVVVSILMQVLSPSVGLYGYIYGLMNNGATPDDLLANPSFFPHIYAISGVWQNFGWDSIIYIAALTSVNPELHESAEIDGAGRFQRMLHIEFPCILPTIIIMLILRMGQVMTIGFEKAYLMQNPLNLRVSEIIPTYVYKIGLGSDAGVNDFSYATAIGLFNSVINLVLITTMNGISKKLGDTSLW